MYTRVETDEFLAGTRGLDDMSSPSRCSAGGFSWKPRFGLYIYEALQKNCAKLPVLFSLYMYVLHAMYVRGESIEELGNRRHHFSFAQQSELNKVERTSHTGKKHGYFWRRRQDSCHDFFRRQRRWGPCNACVCRCPGETWGRNEIKTCSTSLIIENFCGATILLWAAIFLSACGKLGYSDFSKLA